MSLNCITVQQIIMNTAYCIRKQCPSGVLDLRSSEGLGGWGEGGESKVDKGAGWCF